ncbi:hypothetical protein PsorP6_014994 [Peronosclerospora sorghi]|uniref:Uncharacterized protein n=1 Tax=Peronosclerospora sorghi TaxID=230839 RepID=A0ACC0VUK8_9STRA|nr:hypothetical protein PsorP6_014994 [Peronosclerospora sorghi]
MDITEEGNRLAKPNRFNMAKFVVIDNVGKNRNVMYALSDKEDTAVHTWIIERLIEAVGIEPEVFVSDMDLAIEQVISLRCQIRHILFIQYIVTNFPKNLRSKLHDTFSDFMKAFWHFYGSKSQAIF